MGGINEQLAEFAVDKAGWLAVPDADAFLLEDYTVEAFVNRTDVGTPFFHLAAQYHIPSGDRAWSFAIASAGGGGGLSAGDFYLLGSEDGSSITIIDSDIVIEDEKDYYVAASFDLSGGIATFYAQNLTDGTPMDPRYRDGSSSACLPWLP